MEELPELGKRLKELRQQRELTMDMVVYDVAHTYNIEFTKGNLSRWKNGSSVLQRVYDNGLESNRRKYNDVVNDFIESEFQ